MSSSMQMGIAVVIIVDPMLPCAAEINRLTEKIQESMNYTKSFNSIDECDTFVRLARYDHIIIIVTPDKINEFFQHNIHDIRRVQSIFLFDPGTTLSSNEILALKNVSYKMQDVAFCSEKLYKTLWNWIEHFTVGSGILLSVLADFSPESMTTNVVNNVADFAEFWYPLYIDFLLELPMSDPVRERSHFIEQCRIHFSRDIKTMEFINEFEANYSPSKALYYYSRDAFLYRIVNRALRQQAIDKILMFRFLLHDIRDQLRLEYENFLSAYQDDDFSLKFFRGQRMYQSEINELQRKHRTGTLITTNSYFSTSMNRDLAKSYAGQSNDGFQSVLFEVSVNISSLNKNRRKPFAYIGNHSIFGAAESEVLFSVGSFFKINKISYSETEDLWIVESIFINEDDIAQEIIKDFHALRTCPLEIMIISIGNLLANNIKQGICRARTFYQMILNMNSSKMLTIACHVGLGWLALKEKDLTAAIQQQHTAFDHLEELTDPSNTCLTQLRTMCYNCIGNAFRLSKDYDRALEYFLKAQDLNWKIPIDKYAMYDGYQNVTGINIASMYKLMNKIDDAWRTYKKVLAHEMNTSILFHGHTYLSIAQAGLKEAQLCHDVDEYKRCSQTWKAFLDTSLTDMSSNYRRSIISGVLLLGFEYANNEQTYAMAIDYFEKVISSSERYAKVNRNDRLIVLQCRNQVSRLLTKKGNYYSALNYAFDALKMCDKNDLIDITECYESLAQAFQHRLSNHEDLTPEDLSRIILCDDSVPFDNSTIITFQRHEFNFGQFLTNEINPAVLEDIDRQRQLAYCLLKMAALIQMQGCRDEEQAQIDDDELLRKRAQGASARVRELIYRVNILMRNDSCVQTICANNLAYIAGNFDLLIKIYLEDLEKRQQQNPIECVGEDAFGYIAHLHEITGRIDEARLWYQRGVEYFQRHGHLCQHTVMCFCKLAMFYEKYDLLLLAVDVYKKLVDHLLISKNDSDLLISIKPIIIKLTVYFKEKFDVAPAIAILQQFIDLILTKIDDGDNDKFNQLFKEIISKCNGEATIVSQVYLEYLEMMQQRICLTSSCFTQVLRPCFSIAISACKMNQNDVKVIETCQKFIELLFNTKIDHSTTTNALKSLGLELEVLPDLKAALNIYIHIGTLILEHKNTGDLLMAGFVITRCKFIQQKFSIDQATNNSMLIDLMAFYHNDSSPQFILSDYLKSAKLNYAHNSATGIYLWQLEFCLKERSQRYQQFMQRNIDALSNQLDELVSFITANRVNYQELILLIFNQSEHGSQVINVTKQSTCDIRTKAKEWFSSKNQERDSFYWSELLCYLLEWHSLDDEYLASCYMKLGETSKAISVFDMEIYGDVALKFNVKACRRYLKYAYPQAPADQRTQLEHFYRDHFIIEYDSESDKFFYSVLPTE